MAGNVAGAIGAFVVPPVGSPPCGGLVLISLGGHGNLCLERVANRPGRAGPGGEPRVPCVCGSGSCAGLPRAH